MTIALWQRPLARIVMGIVKAGNGAWFDPSDLSTLYQDAAGTIPVTAVEQPVGKILDKSGNGYHATQSVTASRPTLSARKNVLLATETLATQSVTAIASQYTLSFTGTGIITLSGTTTGTLTGTGVNDRVSLTITPTAGTLTLTVSGGVTKAQLELGAVAGPYQRVNTATDYDTDERYFKKYLRFDGIDDYLNLPYMGLYANGSASVVAGISLNISGAQGLILSESNGAAGVGLYYLGRQAASNAQFDMLIRNDANVVVLDSSGPIGLANSTPRVVSFTDSGNVALGFNNSQISLNTMYTRSDPTTLSIATVGATLSSSAFNFLNAKLYSLIITKSALSYAQRIKCERYAAIKAGVTL